MPVEVIVRGPIFSEPTVHAVVQDMLHEAQDNVAAQASSYVHETLNKRIRHPTPYYETQITTQRIGANVHVHDRGVIYGHWLEGTGSRNRTTRFKGYHAFRLAHQRVEGDATRLTEAAVRRHLDRLQ